MSQEEALPLPHLDEHRRSFPPRIDAQLQTRGKESGPLAVAVQQVADKFRQGMEDGWEGCWREAFPSAITRSSRSSIEVIRSIAARRLLWRMFQPYC
ncbi:hypothetical protein CEP52_000032 [Fusarium oligoseptatum]|uniref:Uncharacterized protein n=1 Tax=Fusarium oligoseptatum TaxID=2604345 RepID=A0A428UQS2_9HYPO|nr:hypothetical protein CEP52_000032 [Fusarium oligoseptatum]